MTHYLVHKGRPCGQNRKTIPITARSKRFKSMKDFYREIELTRKNKKLMGMLDGRAMQTKTVSSADARIRLGLAAK